MRAPLLIILVASPVLASELELKKIEASKKLAMKTSPAIGLMHEFDTQGSLGDKHDAGLRPHHDTGKSDSDPLMFRHRYQGHHEETGKMIYYEYAARRHAHVVMVEELDVVSCFAKMDVEGRSLSSPFKITVGSKNSHTAKLSRGAIIAGVLKCNTASGEMEHAIREKLVDDPTVSSEGLRDGLHLTLVTQPAALHECFKDSRLEYYHGHPASFHAARKARAKSLADDGHSVPRDDFATTDQVLEGVYGPRTALVEVGKVSTKSRAAPNASELSQHRRQMASYVLGIFGKDCNFASGCSETCSATRGGRAATSDGICDDGGLGSEYSACTLGTDCADCGPRSQVDQMQYMNSHPNCFFSMDGTDHPSLKVGNQYDLKFTMSSAASITLEVWEENAGWLVSDSRCGSYPPKVYGSGSNEITIQLQDFRKMGCASGEVGFNEFYFKFTANGNTWQSGNFRFLYSTDIPAPNLPVLAIPPTQKFGNASAGLEIKCNACRVGGSGNVHILMRTTNINPFEESWNWGNVSLDGIVDVRAQAWLAYSKTYESAPLVDICAHPICASLKFAGIDVKVGFVFKFRAKAFLGFNAVADVTYKRSIKAAGAITLHSKGTSTPKTDFGGFRFINDGADADKPLTVRLTLDANVSMSLIPEMYLGLFASTSSMTNGQAEVYLKFAPEFKARARFQFRTEFGDDTSSANLLQPLPKESCSAFLLGCNNVCSDLHDTQINVFVDMILDAGYKIYASVQWLNLGSWSQTATFGEDSEKSITANIQPWSLGVGSWCFFLFPKPPRPPNSPPPLAPPPPLPPGYAAGTNLALARQKEKEAQTMLIAVICGAVAAVLLLVAIAFYFIKRNQKLKQSGTANTVTVEPKPATEEAEMTEKI